MNRIDYAFVKRAAILPLAGIFAGILSLCGCGTPAPALSGPLVTEELVVDAGGPIDEVAYNRDFSHFALSTAMVYGVVPGEVRVWDVRVLKDGVFYGPHMILRTPLCLSPDGGCLIYATGESDGSSAIVVDGVRKVLPENREDPDGIVFSGDGRRHAWIQKKIVSNWPFMSEIVATIVVIDGEEESYPSAGFVTFAPDGRGGSEPLFISREPDGTVWLHRGGKRTRMDGNGFCGGERVLASKNGKRTACILKHVDPQTKRETRRLYLNGRAAADYREAFVEVETGEETVTRFWSPDGRHYAFNAYRDGMALLVRDGRERAYKTSSIPEWENTALPVFSPDGRLLHAELGPDGRTTLFLEERPMEVFGPEISVESLKFSPDGRHFSAVLYNPGDRSCAMWIDGKTGLFYGDVGMLAGRRTAPPCFSPKGRHVAYPAVQEEGHWLIVADGREIHFPNTPRGEACIDALWFVSENVLGYYRKEGSKLFRGTVVLPE